MSLAEATDAPPADGEPEPEGDQPAPPADEPQGRQLRIDGMPVSQHTIGFTGSITAMQAFVKALKLGSQHDMRISVVVQGKSSKTKTSGGEADGEASQHINLHIFDLAFIEEPQA